MVQEIKEKGTIWGLCSHSLARMPCSVASDGAPEVSQPPWVFFFLPPFIGPDTGRLSPWRFPYAQTKIPHTHEGQGSVSVLLNCVQACACPCARPCARSCAHVPIPERDRRQVHFFYFIFLHINEYLSTMGLIHKL